MDAKTLRKMPYVSNYPPLQAFLVKYEARCDWQVRLGGDEDDPTGYIEQHRFPNGRTCIIVVHANLHGWDIFTPANTAKIDETLLDVIERLNLG